MNADDKLEYVKYRTDSAFNAYNAAKVLAENGFWNSAVNRLYYAVFYAVNALLVQNEIHASSHSGTRSQFSLHYIKTGKLDKNSESSLLNCTTGDKKEITRTFLTIMRNQ